MAEWKGLILSKFKFMEAFLRFSLIAACGLTGLLCGASLDQSIKQLPARHKMGIKAFSEYAKAADLSNGVLWYAILGISAALASIITAILVGVYSPHASLRVAIYCSGVFAIGHSVCTSQAAPTYHKQKKISDENQLKKLIDKFERIQTVRSICICINFFALLWAIATSII